MEKVDLAKLNKLLNSTSNKIDELKKLYEINEAEGELLIALIGVIIQLGWSRKLTLKLMKAATAIIDMTESDCYEIFELLTGRKPRE